MGDVARVYADHLSGKLNLDPKSEKLELPKPDKRKRNKLGKSILSDDET